MNVAPVQRRMIAGCAVAIALLASLFVAANASALTLTQGAGGPFETGSGPSAVAVGDFNGDGRPDAAVVNRTASTVTVLRNEGHGTFARFIHEEAPVPDITVGASPAAIVVGEFNGDGNLDFATVSPSTDSITVEWGKGDGTFEEGFKVENVAPTGERPTALVAGDFVGGSELDLATANETINTPGTDHGSISVLEGEAFGGFEPPTTIPSNATGTQSPRSIVAADFNGDGNLDLATGNANQGNTGSSPTSPSGTISVYIGDGTGAFTANPAAPTVAGPLATGSASNGQILVGDLNGDGAPDLISANYWAKTLGVALNDGHGGFPANATAVAIPNPPSSSPPAPPLTPYGNGTSCAPNGIPSIGDVDGDGKLDVLVTNNTYKSSCLMLGDGQGGFTVGPTIKFSGSYPTLNASTIADVDGNGLADILIPNGGAGTNGRLSVLLNGAWSSFAAANGGYGEQTVGTISATRSFTLTNTRPDGLPLEPAEVAVTGTNAGAFPVISDGCSGKAVAFGKSCTVKVSYAPAGLAPEGALLGLYSNQEALAAANVPSAGPDLGSAALTGSGKEAPAGQPGMPGADGERGAIGPAGPQGATGSTGATGAPGPVGPAGPAGPRGPIGPEGKVTCVVRQARCGQTVRCQVKHAKSGSASARLVRNGHTFAVGRVGHLVAVRPLRKGAYTLKITGASPIAVEVR
jgi:hypothetical protein